MHDAPVPTHRRDYLPRAKALGKYYIFCTSNNNLIFIVPFRKSGHICYYPGHVGAGGLSVWLCPYVCMYFVCVQKRGCLLPYCSKIVME